MPQLAIEGGFLAPRPAAAPPSPRKPGGDFDAAMSAAARPPQAPRPDRPEAAREPDPGVSDGAPEVARASDQQPGDGSPEAEASGEPRAEAQDDPAAPPQGPDAGATAQPGVGLQLHVALLQLPQATQATTAPEASAAAPEAVAPLTATGAGPLAVAQLTPQAAAVSPVGQPGQAGPAAATPLAQAAQALNIQAIEGGVAPAKGPLAAPVDPFLNWVEAQPEAEVTPVAMGSITPVQLSDEVVSLETSALVAAAASEDAEPIGAGEAEEGAGPTLLNVASAEKPGAGEATRTMSPAPTQPARPEEVLPQILKQAELMKAQQQNTVKLQLYPEHLGKLEIKVMAHQGVLSAQLTADSAQVKGMLETQLAGLQRSLQELGLKVDRVEVALSSAGLGGFDMAGSGFADPRGQGSGQQPSQPSRLAGGYDTWAGGPEEGPGGAVTYAPFGQGGTAVDYVA
ncbi:MAG: flagellar hook-length control protein FliK [Candidatus Sericytochromatia bacterium]|nr:flagellar hook-length control protein FliK [Candidatus Sericytochromatia bacterium]